MKQIGIYAGAPVSLDWREGQQLIVFTIPRVLVGTAAWYAIRGLCDAIGFESVHSHAAGNTVVMEVTHTDQVDQRIMTLIDLLITARYEHPTMVQLALQIDESEAAQWEATLS